MITITDIRKHGARKEKQLLNELKSCKQRTASVNQIINSEQFASYSEREKAYYYSNQELATKDYEKAIENFTKYFEIPECETLEIANKIRVKRTF